MFIKYTLHTFTKINNILKTKEMKTTKQTKKMITTKDAEKLKGLIELAKEKFSIEDILFFFLDSVDNDYKERNDTVKAILENSLIKDEIGFLNYIFTIFLDEIL